MAGAEIIGKEELKEIQELFNKKDTVLYRYGPNNYKTNEFEKMFADYMGVKYAHAVSSGTAAIHCSLAAAEIKKGDEVITTAWTFVAPIEAIVSTGATPILANIDKTFNIDPNEIEKMITSKTKALVVVPMWSAPNMDKLISICENNNIILIEDSAQSLGATFKGKKLGTFGELGSFSFDFGKTLHVGEGGIIITNNKKYYDRAAEFSDHGHQHLPNLPRGKDPRRAPGLNYRMSELSAAVGIAQLNKIDYILLKAKQNKYKIKNAILNIKELEFRKFIDEDGSQGDTLIFSLKSAKDAIEFEKLLINRGFGTKILPEAIDWHYAGAWSHILPKFSFYSSLDIEKMYKPTGELLRRSICLNIPILMDDDKIQLLISSIKDAIKVIYN